MRKLASAIAVVGLGALPSLALAHSGAGHTHSFFEGLAHPLSGVDHLLAMLAVGLWSSQLGGRAVWALPVAFVALLLGGGALGMTGLGLPMVEQGIALSVLLFGALIALAVKLPWSAGALLVGGFALFHGYAHGAEIPRDASAMAYSAGFALASASLHLAGIGLGRIACRRAGFNIARAVGGLIAGAGAVLLAV